MAISEIHAGRNNFYFQKGLRICKEFSYSAARCEQCYTKAGIEPKMHEQCYTKAIIEPETCNQ